MDEGNRSPQNIDDILLDPNMYGLPTFDQYKKDPSKYKMPDDIIFQKVDEGQTKIKSVKKHNYKIKMASGVVYDCDSLEGVQSIADQEGFHICDLKLKPELREASTTGYEIDVIFEYPPKQHEIIT